MRRRALLAAILLLLVVTIQAPAGDESDDAPVLRNDDIVRHHLAGMSRAELIQLVRDSKVEFDLSDEMKAELKLVGIPARVLQAMEQRQALMMPEWEEKKLDPADSQLLRVVLNPDAKKAKKRRLRILDEIGFSRANLWDIPLDVTRFTDIAVYLSCTSGELIPDHWRQKTPLRWDLPGVQRHDMLAFAPGAS